MHVALWRRRRSRRGRRRRQRRRAALRPCRRIVATAAGNGRRHCRRRKGRRLLRRRCPPTRARRARTIARTRAAIGRQRPVRVNALLRYGRRTGILRGRRHRDGWRYGLCPRREGSWLRMLLRRMLLWRRTWRHRRLNCGAPIRFIVRVRLVVGLFRRFGHRRIFGRSTKLSVQLDTNPRIRRFDFDRSGDTALADPLSGCCQQVIHARRRRPGRPAARRRDIGISGGIVLCRRRGQRWIRQWVGCWASFVPRSMRLQLSRDRDLGFLWRWLRHQRL